MPHVLYFILFFPMISWISENKKTAPNNLKMAV
nr:MAG TPA: hypothetical protein [Caudoviricetes sp.]